MPKFIATSSSYFEPFSYDELVKPVAHMQEAHNAAQENADTLAMQAGAIGSMLDDSSPRAKKLYDDYMTSLNNFVDDLMQNGYNANTRRGLSKLRTTYGTDITKINAAITKKAEAVKQYDEDVKKDKTLMTSKDPRSLSLDEWLDNPYAGNYDSYSGNLLTTKASMIGENMRRDLIEHADEWKSILGGQYFERNTFTGFHADEINAAIEGLINGEISSDPRVSLLQSAMQNVYNSSGMSEWASPEQRAQAYSYIGDGIFSAIGENKSTIQQNQDHMTPYQREQLALQRMRAAAAAARAAGAGTSGSVAPTIAALRGNALNGIADRKQSKDFVDKSNVYDALSTINELKKTGALRQPNGALSDAANDAVMKLYNSDYYKQISGGQEHFLSNADLDSVLKDLKSELSKAETNDHIYSFNVTPAAASNMTQNVFKLNIGQLHGKQGDDMAAAVAHYADGKAVKGKDLMSLLESGNVAVGFDAKSGNITVQRIGSDDSSNRGSYDDRIVYLNTRTVLSGTSGYANAAAILYAYNAALPDDISSTEASSIENKIAALTNTGQTVDLRDLANLITGSYNSLAKNGDDKDKAVFNALVEAFAQGLFDSSNTAWSPNNYREGWSAKTGGDTIYDDDDFDLE